MEQIERFRGCLLGLAAGDALGTTLEFTPPEAVHPLTDIIGGGPFHLAPGQWTDDTSMALCLAESLVEKGGFEPIDQMERYLRWFREGYMSSTGALFDIGLTTQQALLEFERTRQPYCGPADPYSASNGSLMRLAPIPMAYAAQPMKAIHFSGESSRTTHQNPLAVDACRYYGGLISGALNGARKEELLSVHYSPLGDHWESQPLALEIDLVAQGSFRRRNPPEIHGDTYVVHSMEAALWAFYHSQTYQEGCLKAANLGEDADTTAAIYGQLAGAYYGINGIPESWQMKIAMRDRILALADSLYHLARSQNTE
jgi:ADP-ribosylglycohydrolase